MITFNLESMPTFEIGTDGKRTGKGGAFTTNTRIDKALWAKMKSAGACSYLSEDDIEDFGQWGAMAGWRYSLKALVLAIKDGVSIKIEGSECKTVKELFDAIQDIPRQIEAEKKSAEQSKLIDDAKGWIADVIQVFGDNPELPTSPMGEVLFDTRNIGGSGSCFVIVNSDVVWYISANGMDGDDWSRNNIPAGIGYVIVDAELVNDLRTLSANTADAVIGKMMERMKSAPKLTTGTTLADTLSAFWG